MTETQPPTSSGADASVPAHVQTRITVDDPHVMVRLLGARDELLKLVESSIASDVHVRGNQITITGRPADNAMAERIFSELLELIQKGETLTADAVRRTVGMLEEGTAERPADVLTLNILSRRGRTIRPKTLGQKKYVDSIDAHTIVFGIGPAGTGKTYLAMAKAVQSLQAKQVNRIILTRPAVEAGERLGFLPGTLFDKIDPYLRPLYDALHDMIDPESIPKLMAAGTIEVAPLAYMRGRAQPLTEKVLTPDGWRRMGELAVGDLVVGSNGLPTPVLGVFPQGRRPVYRVTADDGGSTLACGEHLWTVRTPEGEQTLQTVEMIGQRYELPLVGVVEFVPRRTRLDPHALGLLLGDGHVAVGPESVEAALSGVTGFRSGALTAVLRELEPAEKTAVPEAYLFNSAAVRLAVLQGLLDAGGEPNRREGGVRYTARTAGLRDDVIFLVRSLGGVAYRGGGLELDIRLPEVIVPFRLPRKVAAYEAAYDGGPARFIAAIEPAGEAETVCIQVAADDSLYVTDDLIVTHNTLNDAFIILDEAQNTTPEQMKMFLTRLGFGSKIVVTGDVTQVDLPGGTRSGLRVVRDILEGLEDVHFSTLGSADVVRHRLVSNIVDAYERYDAAQESQEQQNQPGVHPMPGRQAQSRGRRR